MLDELLAAARDDQVDLVVECQQLVGLLTAQHQRHSRSWQAAARQRAAQHLHQRPGGVLHFAPWLQNGSVAALDRQRSDLRHRVGPGFEDRQQHTQRNSHLLHMQALPGVFGVGIRLRIGVVQLGCLQHAAQRIR